MPWYGSFGAFILCSTDPSADIVLEDARIDSTLAPLSTSTTVREVTPTDLKKATAATRDDYTPFATSLGRPPDFNESYAGMGAAGTFIAELTGVPITQSCAQAAEDGRGFTELIVTIEADEGGADVSGVYVDYRADDRPLTLHIDWRLIACGSKVTEPDACT